MNTKNSAASTAANLIYRDDKMQDSHNISDITSSLKENGFVALNNVSVSEADGLFENILKGLFEKEEPQLVEARLQTKAYNVPGLRDSKTKYFSTVDIRDPDHIIPPHCEGMNEQLRKLGFLLHLKPAVKGGYNVLFPTTTLKNCRFRTTVMLPLIFRSSARKILAASSPWVTPLAVLTTPVAYFLRALVPIIRKPWLQTTGDGVVRFTLKHFKVNTFHTASDGASYNSPGFNCTYFDQDLIDGFRQWLAERDDVYYSAELADKALETTEEGSRYTPCYSSKNDYSAFFENAMLIKPEPGTMLIFDNRRYLHSATQYTGEREAIAAFY